jgi:DNA-binding IclR family transcriptional regulator
MIASVVKALEIMETFTPEEPSLSLAEISNKLGYPKTTLYTILATLEKKGYIEKGKNGVYSLGISIIPLTQSVRVNAQLRDRAAPLLRELGNFCGESVYLAIKNNTTCLYIYAIESSHRLLARTAVGERTLMHYTSVGKAILAYLPSEEVEAIAEATGLPSCTENSITDIEMLKIELAKVREAGIASDIAEHEEGLYCLGSPIFNNDGQIIGACSISGTDKNIVGSLLEKYSSGVRYTAQEISRRMGFIPKGNKFIWKEISNPLNPTLHN